MIKGCLSLIGGLLTLIGIDEYIISISKPITNLKSAQMAVGANAVLSDMQN